MVNLLILLLSTYSFVFAIRLLLTYLKNHIWFYTLNLKRTSVNG